MGEIPPRSLQALAVVRGAEPACTFHNQPSRGQQLGSLEDETSPRQMPPSGRYVPGHVFARMEDEVTA